jgi:ABC-type Fe3+-hydroxamate transport system substrate-binding protein
MTRIVSLVPSVTESLVSWGIPPVACTRFCEQPAIAHVGGTKNPDLDAISRLAPDLVVVDTEENRREDAEALAALGLSLHVLSIRSIEDCERGLTGLADRLGARFKMGSLPEPVEPWVRALVAIWRRPLIALGVPTYGASLLGRLGVVVVPSGAGPYPELDAESASALRPQLVLAPSEPYPFAERHLIELATIAPPVRLDGKDCFWWGARTSAAAWRLAGVLAPLRDSLEAHASEAPE